MAEVYAGTKFRTRFASRELPPDVPAADLVAGCRRFAALGVAPAGAGNASVRAGEGFLVTRTAADLAAVDGEDLVLVLACDPAGAELRVAGRHEPSSESLLHAGVYGARRDVRAVLHGHHREVLAAARGLGLIVTGRERPYGTRSLVDEALAVLGDLDFLVLRGHGFLALGASCADALRRTEEVLARM